MNTMDTLLSILRSPGDVGLAMARAVADVPFSDELSWAVALVFWAVLAAFAVKLR